MRKENVFLVSGRRCDAAGQARGPVVNHVVCGVNEESVRRLVAQEVPRFVIVSLIGLPVLEGAAKKVKNVLAGVDLSWSVFVEAGVS